MSLPNVLLVNDDPGGLLAMRSVLERAPGASEFAIHAVASGEDALRIVLQRDFAVILMDVQMPGMDGFATAAAIHAHPRSASVPIIFVSAYLGDELANLRGYECGAVDVLPTPIVPQILVAKVMAFVELARQRDALRRANDELRTLNRQAEERELRIRTIIDNVGEGIITLDEDGLIESFNTAAARIFGYTQDEALGRNIKMLIPQNLRRQHERGMRRYLGGGDPHIVGQKEIELSALHKSGDTLPVELAVNEMRFGGRRLFVGIVRDITRRKEAAAALDAERRRLSVTLNAIGDAIGDAVITTDADGRVTYLNRAAVTLTGWRNEDAVGRPAGEVFHAEDARLGSAADDYVQLALITRSNVTALSEDIMLLHRDGRATPVEVSAAPMVDDDGRLIGVVQVFRDVSHARRIAAELEFQASHDALTGLINRAEFERRLAQAADSAQLEHKRHALMFVDLDQFKVVNDTSGHEAGDELLRQLTAALQQGLRQSDTLARLGGDEFGVLLDGCDLEHARAIAEHLRALVADFRFHWQDKVFAVGASIGLVCFGPGKTVLSDLLRMADSACYVAKDHGRNRVHVYTPEDEELAQRRDEIGWVERIRQALEDDRFVLYAQRMEALGPDAGGAAAHEELLLRMRSADGGIVPPSAFLPAAERYGLMPEIDRWVIREAFSHLAARRQGMAAVCALNLSAASVCDPGFLDFVRGQFAAHRLDPARICFEITESVAISNLRQAAALCRELKALGCRIALDDFGKGMSSFTYLKNLPVDFLKIDGAFVRDMADDPIDRAMVESINSIGHVMGIRTVAEHVETDAVLALLRRLGVDFAQGHAVGRPRPFGRVVARQPHEPD